MAPLPPLPLQVDGASSKPVRVYADGVFDLFHFGHARVLEQVKKMFPNTYLLVGCCNDALVHKFKGKTVMNENERYESLWHCKWVDEVIIDAPWVVTQEFLDKHQIDYVAHVDPLPYSDASSGEKDVNDLKAGGFKGITGRRTDEISTLDIIMRITKDYNEYAMRSLARGYTRKELGVTFFKEKLLQVNMGIRKLKQKGKEQQDRVGQKLDSVARRVPLFRRSQWVENANRRGRVLLGKIQKIYRFMKLCNSFLSRR